MPMVPQRRMLPTTSAPDRFGEDYMRGTSRQEISPDQLKPPSQMSLLLAAATLEQQGLFKPKEEDNGPI